MTASVVPSSRREHRNLPMPRKLHTSLRGVSGCLVLLRDHVNHTAVALNAHPQPTYAKRFWQRPASDRQLVLVLSTITLRNLAYGGIQ